ncbi:hypothetical protein JCM24511_00825 [Saitozyma sp. JCM 24511]|nr:hypothetical protein JCM24511_00825 [Saitozyma sp. JCM 24511]
MPSIPQVQREAAAAMPEWSNPKWKLSELKLEGNTGSISPGSLGWLKPLPATATDEELRREFEDKGVVHVKGAMPRDFVLAMRKRYFEHLAPCGLLKEGTDPVQGIFRGGDPDEFVGPDAAKYISADMERSQYARLVLESYSAEWTDAFSSNQHLFHMVRRMHPEWTSPFVFRRQLIRTNLPSSTGTATGVHYDHIFLRDGPPTALTAWVPIGDCSPINGGLMYLEDSVGVGKAIEEEFTRQGEEKGFSKEDATYAFNSNMLTNGMLSYNAGEFGQDAGGGSRWLIGDYEAGDIVFHHSCERAVIRWLYPNPPNNCEAPSFLMAEDTAENPDHPLIPDFFSDMIHASSSNRDPSGHIRLSVDLRFADRDRPHDARWDRGPFAVDDGL